MKHNKNKVNFPESKLISNNINSLDENVLNLKHKTSKLKNNVININTDLKNLSNSIITNELVANTITTDMLLSNNIDTELININKGYLNIVDETSDNKNLSLVNQEWVLNQLTEHGNFNPNNQINLTHQNISLTTTGDVIIGYMQNNTSQNKIILEKEGNIKSKGYIQSNTYKVGNNNVIINDNNNNVCLKNINSISATILNNEITFINKTSDNNINISNINSLYSSNISSNLYKVDNIEIIKKENNNINISNINSLYSSNISSENISSNDYNINSNGHIQLDNNNDIYIYKNNGSNLKLSNNNVSINNPLQIIMNNYTTTLKNNTENSNNFFTIETPNNVQTKITSKLILDKGAETSYIPSTDNDLINLKYFNEHQQEEDFSKVKSYINNCFDKYVNCDLIYDKYDVYSGNILGICSDEEDNIYVSYINMSLSNSEPIGMDSVVSVASTYLIKIDINGNKELLEKKSYNISNENSERIILIGGISDHHDMIYKNNKLYYVRYSLSSLSTSDFTNDGLYYFDLNTKTHSEKIDLGKDDEQNDFIPNVLKIKDFNDNNIYIGLDDSYYFLIYNTETEIITAKKIFDILNETDIIVNNIVFSDLTKNYIYFKVDYNKKYFIMYDGENITKINDNSGINEINNVVYTDNACFVNYNNQVGIYNREQNTITYINITNIINISYNNLIYSLSTFLSCVRNSDINSSLIIYLSIKYKKIAYISISNTDLNNTTINTEAKPISFANGDIIYSTENYMISVLDYIHLTKYNYKSLLIPTYTLNYSDNFIISGKCYVREITSSSYNTEYIVSNNQTIIHNVPIFGNINNYQIGIPVFIDNSNEIYKMIEINENINNKLNLKKIIKYLILIF